jgi:RHS repeat-associated protein
VAEVNSGPTPATPGVPSERPTGQGFASKAPSVALPKAGGAVRGIGEKFSVNPTNGTAALKIPLPLSTGRDGWTPSLALNYDSGSGNGPFGMGWSLDVPAISRRTDKGLPLYADDHESDVFTLAGSEDLVPVTDAGGARVTTLRTVHGTSYRVAAYHPRVEDMFATIERWTNVDSGASHWRAVSADNITSLFGFDPGSTIERGGDPHHVFSWLISRRFDAHGHLTTFTYCEEDAEGVDLTSAHERNRAPGDRTRQRYLHAVRYGNVLPWFADWSVAGAEPALPADDGFHFAALFDYGEFDDAQPAPDDARERPVRPDPFSHYRAGYEVRTYRRCRRVLMLHHFPDEATCGAHRLVRSLELGYDDELAPGDPTAPVYTFLRRVVEAGFARSGPGYLRRDMPALEMEYSAAVLDATVHPLDPRSGRNLPEGLGGGGHEWVDLYGEGLPGVLVRAPEGWYFKRNLSPLTATDALTPPSARLGPLEPVASLPAHYGSAGGVRLMDVTGGGRVSAVTTAEGVAGYSQSANGESWEPWRPFRSSPEVSWSDPSVQLVDLTGDGRADLLVGEDDVWSLFPSLGTDGFDRAKLVPAPWDDNVGARAVLADGAQTLHLADVSGDGLSDLVRVRNGEVAYWPNLGYGRFGRKVTMDAAPAFTDDESWDPHRVRLADIDGSGTTDLLYVGADGVWVCFNQSANSWAAPVRLAVFPSADLLSSVQVVDLLGIGTACLVWSSPLAAADSAPLRYVDLMSGHKPHLLVRTRNNVGGETRLDYAPSTRFFLQDREQGRDWVTHLPFPVQVVERVEVFDWITRSRFVTRYAYHHGYFDGDEREFRGFAMVEQWDTEEHREDTGFPPAENWDDAAWSPPTLTRTWFHTGALVDGQDLARALVGEYWTEPSTDGPDPAGDAAAMRLPPPAFVAPGGDPLSAIELREATRALKGRTLRLEVFADDGTPAAVLPYAVTETTYQVRCLQRLGTQRHTVLATDETQTLTMHYDRVPDDPHVLHQVLLEIDPYGNPVRAVSVAYPRRSTHLDPNQTLPQGVRDALRYDQGRLHLTATRNTYTAAVIAEDARQLPRRAELLTWEVTGVAPAAARPGVTNLFTTTELDAAWTAVDSDAATIPYEEQPAADVDAVGAPAVTPTRRLIDRHRTLYRRNDLSELSPLGVAESMALPGNHYRLAFTPGLLAATFGNRVGAADLTEGGHVQLGGDDGWWIPGEQVRYSLGPNDPPATELAEARAHFYRVRRVLDPFAERRDDYDAYDLLPVLAVDGVGNIRRAHNDFRVIGPDRITDPNGNITDVGYDALRHVVVSAVRGKEGEAIGDDLTGAVLDLDPVVVAAGIADPAHDPSALLGNASTRIVYDLHAFERTRDQPNPTPAVTWTIERETHVSDLAFGQTPRCRSTIAYSDGSGRIAQQKQLAEPGPLVDGGPDIPERWLSTGWRIRDNKGRTVREFEPFFTVTAAFEFAVQAGVSDVLMHDPIGRVVAALHPDSTWTKHVYGPWSQATWDRNDTASEADPRADSDVGGFFSRLLGAAAFTSWCALRATGTYGATPDERAAAQDAAAKTAVHAGTPTTEHLDPLGRTCLVVSDVGNGRPQGIRHVLDPEGSALAIVDGQGRRVTEYLQRQPQPDGSIRYALGRDLADREILHHMLDSGQRMMLVDVSGHPIRSWDERGYRARILYDPVRRPTHRWLTGPDDVEMLVSRTVYGEGMAAENLCGEIFRHYDNAGVSSNESCDFKGNLVDRSRRLALAYRTNPDWSAIANVTDPAALDAATAATLEADRYEATSIADALNRPVQIVSPHRQGSPQTVIRATFGQGGLVEQVDLWEQIAAKPASLLDPATATLHAVTGIVYDAHSHRLRVEVGNGTVTQRTYDPLTYRLKRLTTTRPNSFAADERVVQDLSYMYDPMGNVTRLRDDADIHDVVFFRNQRVDPTADYTYDAGYRLTRATGREHLGQTGGGLDAPVQPGYGDDTRTRLPHPNDGLAMGTYVETYGYDDAGNLLAMIHHVASGGWTRRYSYTEASTIDAAVTNNRLSASRVPGDPDGGPYSDHYTYDLHGNMTSMAHLSSIGWDDQNQLRSSSTQVVGGAEPETTYYVYDAGGERVRKITDSGSQGGQPRKLREHLFVGSLEIYREYAADGTVTLEREYLLVLAGRRAIAVVETRVAGQDAGPARLVRYQYSNHLPTAVLELDDQAAVLSYEEFFPFGSTAYQAVRAQTDSPKRLRWQGKHRDEENGFYYHSARYYAPWLGRWTSADPEGVRDGPNSYLFGHDNPITVTDPTGTVGLAAGIFGGVALGELLFGGAVVSESAVLWTGVGVITVGGVGIIATSPNVHFRGPIRPLAPDTETWPGPAPAPPTEVPVPPPPPPAPPRPVPDTPIPVPDAPPIPIPPPAIPIPAPPIPIAPTNGPRTDRRTRPDRKPDPEPEREPERDRRRPPRPLPRLRRRRPRGPLRYVTYTKVNPRNGRVYVGRTMGFGDPLAIVAARDRAHHMTFLGYGPARLDEVQDATRSFWQRRSDPAYRAIRGREQQLIDSQGGAISDQGYNNTNSGNAIRGVARGNPRGRGYDAAATAAFGRAAPYTGY